jgi:polysaccharide export outer membrane protein
VSNKLNQAVVTCVVAGFFVAAPLAAQTPQSKPPVTAGQGATTPPTAAKSVELPPGYVIGPEDILAVIFWGDKDMSIDAAVRPDGMISIPLLNEIQAAGLTPEQLRAKVTAEAAKYIEDPNVTVIVKVINSRKVFITGSVGKPGPYPLPGPTTVLQLIAMAGGLAEFADSKNISIVRIENGRQIRLPFNYKDVVRGKNLKQNIELKPGDTVIVP